MKNMTELALALFFELTGSGDPGSSWDRLVGEAQKMLVEAGVLEDYPEGLADKPTGHVTPTITVDQAINTLNEAVALDRDAVTHLIEQRTHTNKAMLESRLFACWQPVDHQPPILGMLGIINALFGAQEGGAKDGWGYIAAVFDDETGVLQRFKRADDPSIVPAEGTRPDTSAEPAERHISLSELVSCLNEAVIADAAVQELLEHQVTAKGLQDREGFELRTTAAGKISVLGFLQALLEGRCNVPRLTAVYDPKGTLQGFRDRLAPAEELYRYATKPTFVGKIMPRQDYKVGYCLFPHENISILFGVPEMPIEDLPKVCTCGAPLTYADEVAFVEVPPGLPEEFVQGKGVVQETEVEFATTCSSCNRVFILNKEGEIVRGAPYCFPCIEDGKALLAVPVCAGCNEDLPTSEDVRGYTKDERPLCEGCWEDQQHADSDKDPAGGDEDVNNASE